jgi:hypothetical protein
VLEEERVVVSLVGIVRIVLGAARRAIGEVLFGVDGTDRTDVGLIARGARRALVEVHVQDAAAEDRDRVRVRGMDRLDDPASGFDLGEQHVLLRIELIDALDGAHIDAGTVLHVDAGFSDDREAGHR